MLTVSLEADANWQEGSCLFSPFTWFLQKQMEIKMKGKDNYVNKPES